MPSAFVTGATGFLGRHLIDVLSEKGWTITAMVRSASKASALLGPSVTCVVGDLQEQASIKAAMPPKVDCVFHIAADTSTWSKEAEQQYRVNVEGTAALLQAMLDRGAKRLVHVSSISVYGQHDGPINEKTPRLGATSWVSYVRTKSYAERKVKEAVDRGMDAVIVNPTHIVGSYDSHNWSRLIQMMAGGTLPSVPPGAGNFANGRAVAEALVTAYEKGIGGQTYILGGPYATFHEFLCIAADQLGMPHPKKSMPELVLAIVSRLEGLWAALRGKRPMITPEELYFASDRIDARSDRAVAELDFKEIPLAQSVKESIDYLRAEKLISR